MKTTKEIEKILKLDQIEFIPFEHSPSYRYTFYSHLPIDMELINEIKILDEVDITDVKEFCNVNGISEKKAIKILNKKLNK